MLAAFAYPAAASDMPDQRGMYYGSDKTVTPDFWTGGYGGPIAAYGSGSVDQFHLQGFGAGAEFGYRTRLPSSGFVMGWEVDVVGMAVKASESFTDLGTKLTIKANQDYMATARLNLGFLLDNNTLLYATGGYAANRMSVEVSETTLGVTSKSRKAETTYNPVIGAGLERKLTEKLSWKIEDIYNPERTYGEKFNENIVRTAINYKF